MFRAVPSPRILSVDVSVVGGRLMGFAFHETRVWRAIELTTSACPRRLVFSKLRACRTPSLECRTLLLYLETNDTVPRFAVPSVTLGGQIPLVMTLLGQQHADLIPHCQEHTLPAGKWQRLSPTYVLPVLSHGPTQLSPLNLSIPLSAYPTG